MNRNLDGTLLTTDDLAAMTLAHNLLTSEALADIKASLHNDALLKSKLLSLTADLRFSLFTKGQLVLNTS